MDQKKKLIIEIILFILLLIGITICYNYLINNYSKIFIQEENSKNIEEEEKVNIIEIKNSEQFEQEVINEDGTVLIDFYATWCMPCRTMSRIIEEIAKENKEIKLVKIDIDNNEELAIKYNIMSIPTMLIMKNGEETKRFVGVTNKEKIVREF